MTKELTEKERKYREELKMFKEVAETEINLLRVHLDDSLYTPEEVKAAAIKIQKERREIAELDKDMAKSIAEFGE